MTVTRWGLHGLVRLVLFPLLVSSIHAQPAGQHHAGNIPTIKSRVNVVLVDVVVTKNRGEPVLGLRKEDFQVLEDGQPQAISFFEGHFGVPPTQVKLPPLPANVFTNYPSIKTTDPINVLLLDLLNTQPKDQVYARAQMLKYLQSIKPGGRLAIFTLGSRLRMVKGVTADTSQVLTAFDDKNAQTGPQFSSLLPSDVQRAADKTAVDVMVMSWASPEAVAALREFQADYASYLIDSRVNITLQAFQHIARYLSSFGGRKNLMWVSGSFPVSIFPVSGERRQYQREIQQTAELLTADQVAVYPIDAVGLVNPMFIDPDNTSKSVRAADAERASIQIAMETLAQDTGGKAFYNTNGLNETLSNAFSDGAGYYTLTYTPKNSAMDGKYRHIQVRLRSGGYRLAYRRGYYAENANADQTAEQKPADDPLLPLMGFGMPDFSQILYKVSVLPLEPQPTVDAIRIGSNTELTGPITRFAVDFAIAEQDIKLSTTPDGIRHGNIQVMLIAYDRYGKPLNMVNWKSEITMQPEVYAALQKVGFQLHREIDIPQGEAYLRVGIYDLNSSHAGTLGIPLSSPPPSKVAGK